MDLIDFILNLAGLLLWLNWRAQPRDTSRLAPPATLVGTLRRADRPRLRGWQFPFVLGALLSLRAIVYWQIGPAVNWTGKLELGVIAVPFRSDHFWRMLLFSGLSFAVLFGSFLLSLLFLSILQPRANEAAPFQPFIRASLGAVDSWSRRTKLVLPFIAVTASWWLVSWPLTSWGIVPPPVSAAHRLEQAAVIGAGSYLTWKYVIVAVLGLHLLNSHVYLGRHLFWNYITALAQPLLRPWRSRPLRFARIDFAPAVLLALVLVIANVIAGGRQVWLFGWHRVPGLQELYQRLPL